MNKALVGLSDNINQNIYKIELWYRSFKRHSNADVVLLAANSSNEETELLLSIGIIPIKIHVDNTLYINHKRLDHTKQYIENSQYDLFIVTDVFDVYFQSDPFAKLDTDKYDIFVSGEGVNVNQEPWNSQNISTLFPDKIDICLDKEIINSGIIAGKKKQLVQLYNKMYDLCEKSNDSHNIKDQAALNVLVASDEIDNLKIFNLDDSWAMHCAVAGPTQFFHAWGFDRNIKYRIPKMINNKICSGNGSEYDIVHQFNRIPAWNNIIYENMRSS
jgi:hypothetical protein